MGSALLIAALLTACEETPDTVEASAAEDVRIAETGVVMVGFMASPDTPDAAQDDVARWHRAVRILETLDGYTASGLYGTRTPGAEDTTVSLIGWRDATAMALAVTAMPGATGTEDLSRLKTGQYRIAENHGSLLPPTRGAFATLVPFSYDGVSPAAVRQQVSHFIALESGSPGWQQAVVLESIGGDPRYDLIVLSAWEREADQVAFYQQPAYLSAIQDAAAAGVIPEGGAHFLERLSK